jgi:hypothetical protein
MENAVVRSAPVELSGTAAAARIDSFLKARPDQMLQTPFVQLNLVTLALKGEEKSARKKSRKRAKLQEREAEEPAAADNHDEEEPAEHERNGDKQDEKKKKKKKKHRGTE